MINVLVHQNDMNVKQMVYLSYSKRESVHVFKNCGGIRTSIRKSLSSTTNCYVKLYGFLRHNLSWQHVMFCFEQCVVTRWTFTCCRCAVERTLQTGVFYIVRVFVIVVFRLFNKFVYIITHDIIKTISWYKWWLSCYL